MARAEVGTAKHQSKQLKASGLQKLKFFCQLCEKQCRDSNGFKNHLNSPSHKGRIQGLSESGKGKSVVAAYSSDFQRDFLRLLKINHGTKKVNANRFYQEYILNDKQHVHMNSTRWSSLTSFVKHLGQSGLVRVEKDEALMGEEGFELEIRYVDQSAEFQDTQAKLNDKKKQLASEENVTMKILNQQISLGKQAEKEKAATEEKVELPTNAGPIKLTVKPSVWIAPVKRSSAFGSDSESDEEAAQPPKKVLNTDLRKFKR